MPKPYCGGKADPPRGRLHAIAVAQCPRQIRAFGHRVVRDEPARATAAAAAAAWGGRRCGAKNSPDAVQGNCRSQHRLYGLLPIVASRADLWRGVFRAHTPAEHAQLPRVVLRPVHPYTQRAYEGINDAVNRGALGTLFCSVVWRGADDRVAAAREPQRAPDGIGFAFGHFVKRRGPGSHAAFHIVHVNVNPPYRRGQGGGAHVSSWIVEELVAAVKHHARSVLGATRVTLEVDPLAPCFQLGNTDHMSERRSQTLEDMYTRAGFSVIPMPSAGRHRRRVELVADL